MVLNVDRNSKAYIMEKFFKSPEAALWARTKLPKTAIPELGTSQRMAIKAKQDDILEQLHKLQLEFAQLEVASSPVRAIPNEILALIFENFVPGENLWGSLFMRVCRRWRDVALNHPPCWSHAHVRIPLYKESDVMLKGSSVRYMELALQRVYTYPMGLHISFPRPYNSWNAPPQNLVPHHDFMAILKNYPQLNFSSFVEMDGSLFLHLLPALNPIQYTKLTTLCIRGQHPTPTAESVTKNSSYTFPNLKYLQAEWSTISAKHGGFTCPALEFLTIVGFDGEIDSGSEQTAEGPCDLMSFLQKSPDLFELVVIESGNANAGTTGPLAGAPRLTHQGIACLAWAAGAGHSAPISIRPILAAFPETEVLTISAGRVRDLPQIGSLPVMENTDSLTLIFQSGRGFGEDDSPATLVKLFPCLQRLKLTGEAREFPTTWSKVPFSKHRQLEGRLTCNYQCRLQDIQSFVSDGLQWSGAPLDELFLIHMQLDLNSVEALVDSLDGWDYQSCLVTVRDCCYENVCYDEGAAVDYSEEFPDRDGIDLEEFAERARAEMPDLEEVEELKDTVPLTREDIFGSDDYEYGYF